jgi:hypothetical protein
MGILGLSIIALLWVSLFIIGCILSEDKQMGLKLTFLILGIGGMIVMGVYGFGQYATEKVKNFDVIEMQCDTVVKSDDKLYVEIDNKTLTYIDKKSYDEINDSTPFYKVISYNLYNSEISTKYVIVDPRK